METASGNNFPPRAEVSASDKSVEHSESLKNNPLDGFHRFAWTLFSPSASVMRFGLS
jgi:hypothetical protein